MFCFRSNLVGRGLTIAASVLKGDILERNEEIDIAKAVSRNKIFPECGYAF